jgi:glyoxylase-like metal-dependent hydrolase (beta-lactamase superfamily II)
VLAYESRDGLTVDAELRDGDVLEATEFRLRAVHTPGHASNHLCFLLPEERLLFSGDHVMEGSTVVIAPPDGDMAAYLDSLRRLQSLRPSLRAIAPGHGHLIDDPASMLAGYLAHRLERERQVLDAVTTGTGDIPAIVEQLYPGLIEELVPRARQSVHAHLRKLAADGGVSAADVDDEAASWQPVP